MRPWGVQLTLFFLIGLFAIGCEPGPGLSGGDGLAPVGSPQQETPDGLAVGHRLMAAGEYELALKAYTRAIPERGLNADVLSALGSANLRLGRLRQAKTFLDQATEREPDFAAAWNNLGVVETSLGNYADAHAAFRAAFTLDNGQSEEIWQNLLLAIKNKENANNEQLDHFNFDLVRRGNGRFLLLEAPMGKG